MSANQKEKKKMSMTGVEEVNIWQAAPRAVLEEQSLQQQNLCQPGGHVDVKDGLKIFVTS